MSQIQLSDFQIVYPQLNVEPFTMPQGATPELVAFIIRTSYVMGVQIAQLVSQQVAQGIIGQVAAFQMSKEEFNRYADGITKYAESVNAVLRELQLQLNMKPQEIHVNLPAMQPTFTAPSVLVNVPPRQMGRLEFEYDKAGYIVSAKPEDAQ